MSIFERHRIKVINGTQHPYKHEPGDFAYSNNRIPGITTLEDTLNTVVAAIWPNYKGTVATPANLPLVASFNDYYVVIDDGDGKSAGYVYQRIDNVNQWIKRYDWDWSSDGLLAEAVNSVSPYYVHKWGFSDKDENGSLFVGDLAGQRIYGGENANEHLILYSNSGDNVGSTGYVQFGDNARPLLDSTFTLGTNLYRFLDIFTDSLTSGTLTLISGSITDTSGSISFGNEDLSTTGDIEGTTLTANTSAYISTLSLGSGSIADSTGDIDFDSTNFLSVGTIASGTHTISSDLILATGSITSVSGAIDFGNEDLSTTGALEAASTTISDLTLDDIFINGNSITISTLDTNLSLSANGTGVIDLNSNIETLDVDTIGTITITGQLNADNIRIDGNVISSTDTDGNINLDPNGTGYIQTYAHIFPSANNTLDLGDGTHRFSDLFLAGSIQDGTYTFLTTDLFPLRSSLYRDVARTLPAQNGDTLFYDSVNNIWIANHPDTEITHSQISGLTTGDAGHTQFAMLAGRSGGQSIQGGTDASENLIFESTANATKGNILTKDNLLPFTNASYSGGWSGIDLGDSTHYFKDVYSKGEFKGFRPENFTLITLPASSATSKGRLVYVTDEEKCYVDTGVQYVAVGGTNKFISDLSYDGLTLVKNIDVSSEITDARNSIFELLDNNNNFEKTFVKMEATSASNIRITTEIELPAGTYRLIVME